MRLDPCILVIFGATGDLTHRKLYPALYNLWLDKLLPERFAVVSIGRREKNDDEVRQDIVRSIQQFCGRLSLLEIDSINSWPWSGTTSWILTIRQDTGP